MMHLADLSADATIIRVWALPAVVPLFLAVVAAKGSWFGCLFGWSEAWIATAIASSFSAFLGFGCLCIASLLVSRNPEPYVVGQDPLASALATPGDGMGFFWLSAVGFISWYVTAHWIEPKVFAAFVDTSKARKVRQWITSALIVQFAGMLVVFLAVLYRSFIAYLQ